MLLTTKKALKEMVEELVGNAGEVPKLKQEIEELKLKKKMEEREIEHLVKLKSEKLDIEHQKKTLELKDQFKDKEMVLQKDFHEKVLAQIGKASGEMQGLYKAIMERLPNVNMAIEKKVK